MKRIKAVNDSRLEVFITKKKKGNIILPLFHNGSHSSIFHIYIDVNEYIY
jgi:hypothetical protein